MASISIVMPCHDRATDLPRILRAYDEQTTAEPFELIAVDDASTDNTVEVLTAYRPTRYALRVERLETNSGPATARNRAIELAQASLILFVGDDIFPEPNFVAEHLQLHRRYPAREHAALGRVAWPDDIPCNTVMAHIDGVGAQQFSYHYMRDGQEYDFRHFYTSNVSLKRELLLAEPYCFDPDFSFAAFEDAELAYRLSRRGLRILYSTLPLGRHYHYHTIRSFAERQYRAGQMLTLFNRKHPNVRELGRWHIELARYWRLATGLARLTVAARPALRGAPLWLETAALDLASFYEWLPNHLLDRYYLGLLRYFWRKGIVDGIVQPPERAAWLHAVHAGRSLAPLLAGHIEQADREKLPMPVGFDHGLLKRLKQVRLP